MSLVARNVATESTFNSTRVTCASCSTTRGNTPCGCHHTACPASPSGSGSYPTAFKRDTVGSPPAIVNAICDAIGVRHVDMPCTPSRVWHAMKGVT